MTGYKFLNEKGEHLHTLDGQPLYGTSTVLSVLSKPLTWWASGLAVGHLGWTPIRDPKSRKPFPKEKRLEAVRERFEIIKEMDCETFLQCLDEAYYAHSKKLETTADAGIDMHSELEKYVKECIEFNNGEPRVGMQHEHHAVQTFANWAEDAVERFLASEVHCFSRRLWTGGIVDLIYLDCEGRYVVFDFKSAKAAYDSHFLQDAGYGLAIAENGILTANGEHVGMDYAPFVMEDIYYGVFPFGMPEPEPQFRFDVAELQEGFEACVTLHKLLNSSN